MTHIAIVGLGKVLEPHAEVWLGAMPQARFHAGSKRLKQVVDASGSCGGANVMAFSHAASTDIPDAIEADRDSAITGEDPLATQHLIKAILEKGGT